MPVTASSAPATETSARRSARRVRVRRALLAQGLPAMGVGWLAGGCVAPAGPGEPVSARADGGLPASPRLDEWAELRRIAFGSCANQHRAQPIWEVILGWRPQLFIFAGDNVYGDRRPGGRVPESELMTALDEAYAKAATIDGLRRLRATVPHVATWDDHDYGLNDASGGFRHKFASQRRFLDYWRVDESDPRRRRDGVYHAWSFGPPGRRVQVVALDTRFFRSPFRRRTHRQTPYLGAYEPADDAALTMLGDAQWAWLGERLREPADLRLVVSSIQVLADGHSFERWGLMPREQAQLFDLIRATRAGGVVFLSGDRHLGALYRQAGVAPYPMIEITSSGLTEAYPNSPEQGANRVGDVYGAVNFGTVEVDWRTRRVLLALRDARGETVRSLAIDLSDLASPKTRAAG